MDELPLMVGIVVMLVAAAGSVLYVALVIAIPVCRALDWFADPKPDEAISRPAPSGVTMWARLRRYRRRRR